MTLPLYERIQTDLREQISSGILQPGDRLPVEHELMDTYSCARMTVNKALSALSSAGLVERRKRSGTIVARPRVHSMIIDVPDLPTEVAAKGKSYRYGTLSQRQRKPATGDDDQLAPATGDRLLETKGLHFANEVAIAIEHRLVSLRTVPAIAHIRFDVSPPGTWLLKHVPWTEAETRVAAHGADPQAAALLRVRPGHSCLVIERRTWRGADQVTWVRQTFLGSDFDLLASFDRSTYRDARR